ncbi:MAG: helix-turn-helix domain-containing protein [Planctomycetes bacterium]|nr:helix-turn-helix domain-containing protein [Planctomycetota bacterium]
MEKAQQSWTYRVLPRMLRRLRENAGLTQRELATRVRRTQPWVHKSEIGERRVDITEFLSWCLACKVDPEDVFRDLIKNRRIG